MAASVTDLVIGPAVSWLCEIGMRPSWETSPTVGLSPTIAFPADGQTIEPSVSVPIATAHRLAAAATADPELDPHGSAPRSYGLRVEAAARAPAVEVEAGLDDRLGSHAPEVRPFGEIGLAQDDGARRPEASDDPRVAPHAAPDQRQRAGRRLHRVIRRDVVLDQDGDPMERPTNAPRSALGVPPGGDVEGCGVRLDDRVEDRIEPVDPSQVRLGQLQGGEVTGRQQRAQLRDRCLEPRSGRVPVDVWDQRGTDARIVASTGPRCPGGPSSSGRS